LRILVVEDEPRVADLLARGLREAGHAAESSATGEEALERLQGSEYEAIVLDLGLPGMDGFDVLRALRSSGDATPVLILTARDAREDVVLGLDLGADDYLTKPFDFAELAARLRAVSRRATAAGAPILRWGDLVLDRLRRDVRRGSERVDLTPTEFRILEALMDAEGGLVSRQNLLARVWGYDFDPGTSVVEVHLAHLRRKLEAGGHKRIVITVRGEGYGLASVAES
jgi:DNA-binding response OmpR family regulator